MPKAKSVLPVAAASAAAAASPFDDLDEIANILGSLVPKLQEATRALRARDSKQQKTFEELSSQVAAKDARIAQLEALVAEANARSERSRAIHAEFERRLLDDEQRWQATLANSQGLSAGIATVAMMGSEKSAKEMGGTGKSHGSRDALVKGQRVRNDGNPLLQRTSSPDELVPERPATTPRTRTTPGTAAHSTSEPLLALPAPRGNKPSSPPTAPFRETTLKTMATPRTGSNRSGGLHAAGIPATVTTACGGNATNGMQTPQSNGLSTISLPTGPSPAAPPTPASSHGSSAPATPGRGQARGSSPPLSSRGGGAGAIRSSSPARPSSAGGDELKA